MSKLTYISLFSSAGVGCYGFKQEGFDCIATCELIEQRLNVQKANKKCKYESGYIAGDLTKDETKEKLFAEIKKWEKKEELQSVDVVVATPPCQGMSTANYKKGDETKRNSLVVEAISIIKKVNPKIFIFENVQAFLKTSCTDISGENITIKESIDRNLADDYYVYAKVINFKDFGVPSSRPRTIVIGTRKDYLHFSPLNIFPLRRNEITVRQAIGDLEPLEYGQISHEDVYHFFREYPRYMEEWIAHIGEGDSAFSNPDEYKPYKIVNGQRELLKGGYLGNKFRRLFWDKSGACIATRNDQLASQDTIHPRDNRVLSIRELMRLMTIPNSFKWVEEDVSKLVTENQKRAFLKKNELNIRRCIGEAVPTFIMQSIAANAKQMLKFQEYVEEYYKKKSFSDDEAGLSYYEKAFKAEMQLCNVKETGSYYTPQSVVFEALSSLDLSEKKSLDVLEPSVGLGAFLPQLFRLVNSCSSVSIDVCDIDNDILTGLVNIIGDIDYDRDRIKIRFIHDDFITTDKVKKKYDLIVSNPPFAKVDKNDVKEYRKIFVGEKSENTFTYFLHRYKQLSDEIIVVLPKSFLMASEYNNVRNQFQDYNIVRIVDFGVKFFKEVFVEILSFHFKKNYNKRMSVVNKLFKENYYHNQGYIFHDRCWLIYRDSWFDEYIQHLQLDVFDFFRDRQITNKKSRDVGDIWLLRSKNILDDGTIVSIPGYDKFINSDDLEQYTVSKYMNKNALIMPNFTYLTRAAYLPDNCIPNGSIAILLPKYPIEIDTLIYSTQEFRRYYEIVKNKAKFTLNIDSNSIYYIGVKNDD